MISILPGRADNGRVWLCGAVHVQSSSRIDLARRLASIFTKAATKSAGCCCAIGDVQVLRALEAGARGYLLKSALRKELPETIRLVHAGHKRIAPEVATELAEHAADDALSPRELAVLRLIASGNANKMIAAHLSITEETVKGHVKNVLAKLAANDRTHAVTIGLKRGIIEL